MELCKTGKIFRGPSEVGITSWENRFNALQAKNKKRKYLMASCLMIAV